MNGSDTTTDGVPPEVQRLIEEKGNCWPYLPLLYELAKGADTILELGVGSGRSTKTLLYGCRDGRVGTLRSVDWGWTPSSRIAAESIEDLGLSKHWEWVQEDFFEMPDEWFKSRPADLVWIDIGISSTGVVVSPFKTFFEMVRKCSLSLKTGSILLLHNTLHNHRARDDLLRFIKTGGYGYEEKLELNGLGMITKLEL